MKTIVNDLSEFIFFFVVFAILLIKEVKKKKRRPIEDEEPSESSVLVQKGEVPVAPSVPLATSGERPLGELHSSLEGRQVHSEIETRSIHGLLTEGEVRAKKTPSRVRRRGDEMMVSYEILSLPLSLRAPRV